MLGEIVKYESVNEILAVIIVYTLHFHVSVYHVKGPYKM